MNPAQGPAQPGGRRNVLAVRDMLNSDNLMHSHFHSPHQPVQNPYEAFSSQLPPLPPAAPTSLPYPLYIGPYIPPQQAGSVNPYNHIQERARSPPRPQVQPQARPQPYPYGGMPMQYPYGYTYAANQGPNYHFQPTMNPYTSYPPLHPHPHPHPHPMSRMTHHPYWPSRTPTEHSFHEGPSPALGSILPAPSLFQRPRPMPASKVTSKSCHLCLDVFDKDLEANFPYRCVKCQNNSYCLSCLKDWFLEACKNESKMPPKCCATIPISVVTNLLSLAEIQLYKSKYEEFSTPNRLYCPVPTCSAFIPPKTYVIPKCALNDDSTFPAASLGPFTGLRPQAPVFHSNGSVQSPTETRPRVSCPDCGIVICMKCRAVAHLGECSGSDIPPELEEQLRKWRIKRCPRCRAGVRKVFGCSHVECRCGAHFCWECLKPIQQCDGRCEEEPEDELEGPFEDDDLDGHAGFHEGDGHEFGEEPGGDLSARGWGCRHVWAPALASNYSDTSNFECKNCFRSIFIHEQESESITMDTDNDVQMGVTQPLNNNGQPAWQCANKHICCGRCLKEPPIHRANDVTRQWHCDCGLVCQACDKRRLIDEWPAVQRKKREREITTAWECQCGEVVCGVCKVYMEAHRDLE